MAVNEETGFYAMGQGCPVHGDEYMRECSMCGAEFCRMCVPKSAVCPDCANEEEDEEEEEEEEEEKGSGPDFDDVSDLGKVLDDDEFEDEDEDEDEDDDR